MKSRGLSKFIFLILFLSISVGIFTPVGFNNGQPEIQKTEAFNLVASAGALFGEQVGDFFARNNGTCKNWEFDCHLRVFISGATAAILGAVNIALGWVGNVFDYAVEETVITVGDKFNSDTEGYGFIVSSIWKIFRDIGNLLIIFSLLYLAIRTIVQGNGFADGKMLSSILIAALLINFSLFFTKLAFDFSNIAGITIYESIRPQSGSISEGVMQIVNFQGVINNLTVDTGSWTGFSLVLLSAFFVVSMAVILGFIFVSAGILLLYRFFTFIILMMISPIGLIARFIPWLKKLGTKWWDELTKQTILLPVFFLIFYIGLLVADKVFENIASEISQIRIDSNASPKQIGGYLASFIILVFFLGASLFIPGKIGGMGAGVMTSAGNKLKGWGKASLNWSKRRAGGLTLGTAGAVGRQTVRVGAALTRIGGDKSVASRLQKAAPNSILARQALRAGAGLQSSSFDVRNIKVGKGTLGSNLGVGQASKAAAGGIKGITEEKSKKIKERYDKDMKIFGKAMEEEAKENQKVSAKAKKDIETASKERSEAIKKQTEIKNKIANIESKNERNRTEDEKKALVVLKQELTQAQERSQKAKTKRTEAEEILKNVGSTDKGGVYTQRVLDPKTKGAWGAIVNLTRMRNSAISEAKKKITKKETDIDKIIKGLKEKQKEDEKKDE